MSAPRWRDGLLVAASALAVYLLSLQDTFYKVDSQGIVKALATGGGDHRLHFLFFPVLRAVAFLLAPLGLDAYQCAGVASALGTAAGVLCTHRAAAALGLARRAAALVTVLVATTPAVVFFATVVEFHGVFFAFAGLAWWLMGRLVRSPSPANAVLLGAGTCLAGFTHGTGQLLPVPLLLWALAEGRARGMRQPRLLLLLAIAAATHLGVASSARLVGAAAGDQLDYWLGHLTDLPPLSRLPATLWHEWLVPYAPLSVLCLPAMRRSGGHLLALLVGLLPYLLTCWIMLRQGSEIGAYQTPLAIAAALLVERALPHRWLVPAALAGLGFGLGLVARHDVARHAVARHDVAPGSPELVRDLRAATAGGEATFLAGSSPEVDALVRWAPEIEYQPFYDWLAVLAAAEARGQGGDAAYAAVGAWLDGDLAKGRAVYVLPGAMDMLRGDRALPVGERLLAWLATRYRFVEVKRGVFLAWRVERAL